MFDEIGEAKERLFKKAFDKGAVCPCCDQFVKVYKRKIHHSMARALIYAYKRKESFECKELAKHVNVSAFADFPKLRYWGLISKEEYSPNHWKITPLGIEFVRRNVRVPRTAVVYNGELLRVEGELVTIGTCLNDKFDYEDLMRN